MADRKDLIEQVDAGLKIRDALVGATRKLWDEETLKLKQVEDEVAALRTTVEQLEVQKEQEERVEQEEKKRRVAASRQEMLTQLGLLDLTKEQLASIILEIGREGVYTKHDLLPIIRKEREAGREGDEAVDKTPMDEKNEAFRLRDDARQEETRRIEKLIGQRSKNDEPTAEDDTEEREEQEAADKNSENVVEPAADVDEDDDDGIFEDLALPKVEPHPIDVLYEELAGSERYECSQAAATRQTYKDTKEELTKKEKELSDAQKVIQRDYGVDNLFFGLRDKCVESDAGQYVYKVCFFGKATQDLVKLGDMEDIKGPVAKDGKVSDGNTPLSPAASAGTIVKEIKFSNGHTCWNGPNRSLTVQLVCGPSPMKLFDIEEPSTCVYLAKLRTPVVCSEDDRERMLRLDGGGVAPHYIEVEVLPTL